MGEAKQLAGGHHYIVISSDNHAGADLLDYKPFLARKWHEEFDAWAAEYTNPWDFVDPRLMKDDFDVAETELLTGAASWHSALNWDSERRLEHMDLDGVTGEVIFPNTAPPFMPGSPSHSVRSAALHPAECTPGRRCFRQSGRDRGIPP